ncbi:hypothetical protein [Parahaliea aestuarii]|uniref:ATP-grasp domain-containing protein n=1 Tax=Parahaliea aestuarii TaxID=1852021 RepID=A0A5C8ZQN6_9GAMM|nr:hypothetical protein [Parahaliea aestuarii]TXS89641.1 hypothetical protein FVW59_16625 [Parahaliea aestuarii]
MANVLVPESHTRAGLGVIRSLGAAGHNVHACSSRSDALGFVSAYASSRVVHPPYGDETYIDWLRGYLRDHAIGVIIPSSNFLLAVEAHFDEFLAYLPLSADRQRVFDCLDKAFIASFFSTCDGAGQFRQTQPPHVILTDAMDTGGALPPQGEHGYYLKGCHLRSANGERSDKGALLHIEQSGAVAGAAAEILQDYECVLVQQGCTGRQVCVGVLRWQGEARLLSTVEDCHEEPHSNGTMSRRRTARHEAIEADALLRLEALNWEGVAMLEYRLDAATGRFFLIEINFRYWQYLNLDLRAGADFPALQVACYLGQVPSLDGGAVMRSTPGLIGRDTWPGEVACLVNQLRRPGVRWYNKVVLLLEMLSYSLRPGVHNDLLTRSDPRPYFANLFRFIRAEIGNLGRKSGRLLGRVDRNPDTGSTG